ncbi:MAG: hypothetical protein ABI548_13755 [Polyangiaceae bacterium]
MIGVTHHRAFFWSSRVALMACALGGLLCEVAAAQPAGGCCFGGLELGH